VFSQFYLTISFQFEKVLTKTKLTGLAKKNIADKEL